MLESSRKGKWCTSKLLDGSVSASLRQKPRESSTQEREYNLKFGINWGSEQRTPQAGRELRFTTGSILQSTRPDSGAEKLRWIMGNRSPGRRRELGEVHASTGHGPGVSGSRGYTWRAPKLSLLTSRPHKVETQAFISSYFDKSFSTCCLRTVFCMHL